MDKEKKLIKQNNMQSKSPLRVLDTDISRLPIGVAGILK